MWRQTELLLNISHFLAGRRKCNNVQRVKNMTAVALLDSSHMSNHSSPTGESIVLMGMIGCHKHWTYISGKCYRVLPGNRFWSGCDMHHPANTGISNMEYFKLHLRALFDLAHQDHRFYPKPSEIKVSGRCSYVERCLEGEGIIWEKHSNCLVYRRIAFSLSAGMPSITGECTLYWHRIRNVCYSVGISGRPLNRPLPNNFNTHRKHLDRLSAYLAKTSNQVKSMRIVVHDPSISGDGVCRKYKQVNDGEVASWVAVNASCDPDMPRLCVQPGHGATLPRACQPREFRCGDGTCIVQLHRCDGDNDCLDNSDEMGCEFGCSNYTQCFGNCRLPRCKCSFQYFQCSSGMCLPLS